MDSLFKSQTPEDNEIFQAQLQKHTERYYPYTLSKNPFPLGGNYPDAYLPYTYLAAEKAERVKDFLVSTFVREEFNGLLVKGEYGAGKSHVLHYIRQTIISDSFFGNRALCFLIQNPSVVPEDILLSMLREVKLGVVQDLIFAPVASALKERYSGKVIEFLSDFTSFDIQTKFDDAEFNPSWYQDLFALSYREFIKRLSDQDLDLKKPYFQDFARDALNRQLNIDATVLIDDFIKLLATDDSQNIKSWETFLSSRLMSTKKGSLGVEYYLQAFLELFRNVGVRHIYLLVDEFEDLRTQRLSTKATVEYLATLRKMIQHNYKMFSLVLACTRDAWSDLLRLYPAIEDRFPLVIDLSPDEAEVKNVILRYLEIARQEGISPESRWAPFTEESINLIIEKRGFVLRHVLTEMRAILDAAVNKGADLPINQQFVMDNLSSTL